MLLVDRAEITKHRQISQTVYDDVLNQYIRDAQFLDVQDLLCAEFYNDLMMNSTDAEYVELLNRGIYQYNGTEYTNVGLKTVICYYAHARYLKFGSATDTPFSLVEKTNNDSQIVSEKTKQILYKQNQQIAYKYWMNVEAFLNRKKSNYPLWKVEDNCKPSGCRTFRINKIV